MPRLSVITAVRNANPYIEDAVNSILSQTLKDFEYLIIDDASDDGTFEILETVAKADSRIRLLRNDSVLGPYRSANLAIAQANSPLIARMDGDDFSHPDRLLKQVQFMDCHPEHILVATSYEAMDDAGGFLYRKYKAADDFCVRWLIQFRMCAEHPTFCFRRVQFDGEPVRYCTDYPVGQDYELLTRLASIGKVAILPEILFKYRIHTNNITSTRSIEQKTNMLRIATAEQSKQLPATAVDALAPFMRAYILEEKVNAHLIKPAICALREIVRKDHERAPLRHRWIKRQTAELLAHGLLRNGKAMYNPKALSAFLVYGAADLPSLSMRFLENKDLLPAWMESYPTVE